jgi:hypothetical protein
MVLNFRVPPNYLAGEEAPFVCEYEDDLPVQATLSILNQHASVPQATSTDSGTYTTLTGIFQHTSADDHEMLPPRMTTQFRYD